ncbi:MAG: pyrroline-5-carboxylate reductase [Campylobacterota bacterium]|nr:pyrroline-5-carboxylate reductase [Campylobacterota bacterium]
MNKLTFIGNGNMALAIAQGLKEKFKFVVVGRSLESIAKFEERLGVSVEAHLLDEYDITDQSLIFCVKPANLQEVSHKLKGTCNTLYSVLAGTTCKALKESISSQYTIRAMPNLAASKMKSMTILTGDVEKASISKELFGSIGETLWVEKEKELDIGTALSGSGPAYLALVAEALCDGAVKQGLKRADAMTLMRGLFDGFGTIIQDSHPAILKDGVMSPAGTTAAGYGALEDGNVRASFINAIEKAFSVTQKE